MTLDQVAAKVRAHALAYPEAWEDFPWDESVIKVRKKVFVFLGHRDDPDVAFGLGVKLPESKDFALTLPYTEPTGYGLGKAGWVSATFTKGMKADLDLLLEWVDESYRAVAPKTLVKQLDAGP
ncbi:MAG: MmcQ/YjbR family DNA-binding protein [Actinomycetota bacterium]